MNNLWKKYASVLVDYSVNVQKDDLVIIKSESTEAQPLIKEIYRRVLEKGAHPVVRCSIPGINEIFIREANDEQLAYVDPMTKLEYEKADKFISIGAPLNVKNMARADKNKLARRSKATKPLSKNSIFFSPKEMYNSFPLSISFVAVFSKKPD